MERGRESPPPTSSTFQARLWRNLQLGRSSKGCSGTGAERRTAETPRPPDLAVAPGGPGSTDLPLPGLPPAACPQLPLLRKRRHHVLDRVFSSSQPNLCCSGAESLEAAAGGTGGTLRRLFREHLLPQGRPKTPPPLGQPPGAPTPPPQAPPQPAGVLHCRSLRGGHLAHQKSSSLPGTQCLRELLESAPGISTTDSGGGPPGASSAAVTKVPDQQEDNLSRKVFSGSIRVSNTETAPGGAIKE